MINQSPGARRFLLRGLGVSVAGLALPSIGLAATASAYPDHALRLISPYAAGGSADVASRLFAEEMSKVLGQPVVVDNLAGGSGSTGALAAARAPADGYTFYTGALGPNVLQPLLNERPVFDPRRDLQPVIKLVKIDLILVARRDLPARDLPQLVTLGRKSGARLTYGSSGAGGSNHLAGELIRGMAVPAMTHVPYRGESPALTDLLGGQLDLAVVSATVAQPQVAAGRIKALVALGSERSQFLPSVPTMVEQGYPNCVAETWFGFFLPTAAPQAAVEQLYSAAMTVLRKKSVHDQLLARGMVPLLSGNDPAAFAASMADETRRWSAVVKAAGIRLE